MLKQHKDIQFSQQFFSFLGETGFHYFGEEIVIPVTKDMNQGINQYTNTATRSIKIISFKARSARGDAYNKLFFSFRWPNKFLLLPRHARRNTLT